MYNRGIQHTTLLKGFKMSKSLGNVVDPKLVIEGGNNLKKEPAYGADVLRLWVATVDYSSDVRIGPNAIKQVFEQYRKLRNTLRYMVGNVADVPLESSSDFAAYDAAANYDTLPSLDKWLLGRLNALEVECYDAYDSYQFQRAVNALSAFATNELSALYLDVAKDRLYVSPQHSARRRSCQRRRHAVWRRPARRRNLALLTHDNRTAPRPRSRHVPEAQ